MLHLAQDNILDPPQVLHSSQHEETIHILGSWKTKTQHSSSTSGEFIPIALLGIKCTSVYPTSQPDVPLPSAPTPPQMLSLLPQYSGTAPLPSAVGQRAAQSFPLVTAMKQPLEPAQPTVMG